MRNLILGVMWLVLAELTVGCATRPTDQDELKIYLENNDPLEPMNRAVFHFNDAADTYVMTPVAQGYHAVVPDPIHEGISNFFQNLKQPIYLINAMLQGDLKGAGAVSGRFVVNTLFGFFGVFDTASKVDIPVVKRDFGQTLAVWGVKGSGPYLMLPILGPTTVRDAAGLGVDSLGDPVGLVLYEQEPWLAWSRTGANGFLAYDNVRDLKDNMKKNSTDYYATMRSMYQQNRNQEIKRLRGEEDEAAYDFDFPDDDEEE